MAKRPKDPSTMDRKLTKVDPPKQPRNQYLPGTDGGIKALDDVAVSYADIRDKRIALNAEEHTLKDLARALMKKFEKTIYRRQGIEILLVARDEDVKVKVPKKKDDDDDTGGENTSRTLEVTA